jgi:hypothetical protein
MKWKDFFILLFLAVFATVTTHVAGNQMAPAVGTGYDASSEEYSDEYYDDGEEYDEEYYDEYE